ncbi:uncharacterized protein E0L32_003091 [Thyridium curvatum]|uniref:ethanolamine kinase n=1 Tax=Thyridium curvatum TaxID=1093900 RepID=A0A507BLA1_9PEZI|nr:uncharacterized protein E0L32_003091 [Thyridium curvatum]TPX17448.1 hypothetical protein E0L32_003091 [Thyridium curvatum]
MDPSHLNGTSSNGVKQQQQQQQQQPLSNSNSNSNGHALSSAPTVPFIPLSLDSANIEPTALEIIFHLRPAWRPPCTAAAAANGDSNGQQQQEQQQEHEHHIHFVRFTEGITNTLVKAVRRLPGVPRDEADRDAILLRAYGNGTDVIIDRQRETQNHELLMRHGLAPELLARFRNGMAYRFIPGAVARPEDLRRPELSVAIARRLAQWHATVPCIAGVTHVGAAMAGGLDADAGRRLERRIDGAAPGKRAPNLWTVLQKWILALPTKTEAQRARQADLQTELERLVGELSQRRGLGEDGLVFAHTDLLSANVIVLPPSSPEGTGGASPAAAAPQPVVTFIDYEYAVPSPAAFDIANHFAEWGGFDCDMSVLPTVAQRRRFVSEYVRAYAGYRRRRSGEEEMVVVDDDVDEVEAETARLLAEVDVFRGIPGFYWGIWALIQATISRIDFDYASYAEQRLGEYWAWRAEEDGSRAESGAEMPLRERRWAQLE